MNKLFRYFILVICTKAGAQTPALVVGDSLYQTGAYSEAINVYKQLPISPEVYERIGRANEALGKTSEAISAYDQAYQLDTDNLKIAYKYATLLRIASQYKQADSILRVLNAKFPQNASVLYQLGYVKEQLRDTTAVMDYIRAYTLDNNQQNALYRLAKLLLEKRSFVSAKTHIDLGLEADPNSTRFIMLDALSFYVNNSFSYASERFERLLELGKDNESIREKLANCYARTYQYEKALEQFRILINEYDDQNANWHYNLSKVYMGLNEIEKARRHVNIAIGLLDVPLDAYLVTLAITYNRDGNYKAVMETLQEALKENPENETAKFQLAVAADNRYQDKSKVLPYYEAYVKEFEDGRNIDTVLYRISDLKKELFMNKD